MTPGRTPSPWPLCTPLPLVEPRSSPAAYRRDLHFSRGAAAAALPLRAAPQAPAARVPQPAQVTWAPGDPEPRPEWLEQAGRPDLSRGFSSTLPVSGPPCRRLGSRRRPPDTTRSPSPIFTTASAKHRSHFRPSSDSDMFPRQQQPLQLSGPSGPALRAPPPPAPGKSRDSRPPVPGPEGRRRRRTRYREMI